MRLLALFTVLQAVAVAQESSIFAAPGRMVELRNSSHISLYCAGAGAPTIVLESGFGGGTASTWHRLFPKLATISRTCAYDRAGYGFSSLGSNLPRDLNNMVQDLAQLLSRAGEKPPFVLIGHSNGGVIVSAFANRYPAKAAGLIFLDAAVTLPEDVRRAKDESSGERTGAPLPPALEKHLSKIQGCLARSKAGLHPASGDPCADPDWYRSLPDPVARAEIRNLTKLDYWRAYLSEAENNYRGVLSSQARKLLPHKWTELPVRVFIASAASMSDAEATKAFGTADPAALQKARENRLRGEQRQARICDLARNCRIDRIPTTNHLVHDAAPDRVIEAVIEIVESFRRR